MATEDTAVTEAGAAPAEKPAGKAEKAPAELLIGSGQRINRNPTDISFWALVAEDYRTNGSKLASCGFWALFVHRYGNWRFNVKNRLLAFPLNFVPTVGAIAASLPPVIVALVDPAAGPWTIAGVVIGLGAVNGLIGAILDPRYVGHAVKVSPLVVFLSMLVWGFLWGPIGMILAVPIMVSVKVICARIPALEPIATLMKG